MDITALAGQGNAQQAPGAKPAGSEGMGKQDFMRLLVTQLSRQDPLNPTDSTQFVTQLAQFSSLEQLVNIKGSLDVLSVVQTAGTSAQVTNLIGKDITFNDNSFNNKGGESVPLRYELTGAAKSVTVHVKDEDGKLVRTLELGSQGAGKQDVSFDAMDAQGKTLPDGTYRFEIIAQDESGDTVGVISESKGRVTGVQFEGGYPQLVLQDGRKVPLGQVLEVMQPPEPLPSTGATQEELTAEQVREAARGLL